MSLHLTLLVVAKYAFHQYTLKSEMQSLGNKLIKNKKVEDSFYFVASYRFHVTLRTERFFGG
jgi:hypothetical protein